ncbi:helix-turn-helix domain-containing protein [Auraticoccus monumenti]|uniref:DNA binding domain-containing protein, excisionase family n=1 Tax=Auraticoccus monumenti TaxID=675864 RepID=A0A1G6UMV3_9ACTN|nr:helix-turn-helix domain-containing protein [Auraticoccus monumenti]SDD41855.1 DNA binding domain-containing protein, excisionase family [Auraticoccus monumenti]
MEYTVTVDLAEPFGDEDAVDRAFTQLADYHVSLVATPVGGLAAVLVLDAPTIRQATSTSLAVTEAAELHPVGIHVLTTTDWERRMNSTDIPPLVSVQEAADILGVTRQAVLSRIGYGTLPSVKVGTVNVIPLAAVQRPTDGQQPK